MTVSDDFSQKLLAQLQMSISSRTGLLSSELKQKECMPMFGLPHIGMVFWEILAHSGQNVLDDDVLSSLSISAVEGCSRQRGRRHDGLNAILSEMAFALLHEVQQFISSRLEIRRYSHFSFQLIFHHC